jgi:hypothetical protein
VLQTAAQRPGFSLKDSPRADEPGCYISFEKYLAFFVYNDYNRIQKNTPGVMYEQGYFNTDFGRSGFETI